MDDLKLNLCECHDISIEELVNINGGADGDSAYRLGQAAAIGLKASLGVLSILFLF